MKRLCLSLLASALLSAASSPAQEIVAQYTFPATGNYSSSATSLLASASAINNAAGGTITSTGLHYFRNNSSNAIPESLDAALANNTYIGFTVTPASYALDYHNFTFDFGITNSTTSVANYTGNWALFSSATGFSSSAQLIAQGSLDRAANTGSSAFWGTPSPSINLDSFAALQGAGSPVEFRLYFWDNSTTSTSSLILRVDNITVSLANNPVAITTHPAAQTVTETGTATFTVAVSGSAPFTYQWKRNGVDLVNDARISGVSTATLTITGVAPADAGNYSVAVSNLNNAVTSNAAALTVDPLPVVVPAAPVAGSALLVSNVSFVANWSAASGALGYVLDVSGDSNFSTYLTGYQARSVGNQLTQTVTDLTARTTYYYRVRATNNIGASANSNTVTVTTTAPNDPPTLTSIPNQTIAVSFNTNPLTFTVDDSTTPAADLTVTAISNNTALVPNNATALALGGSGAARTLVVTPTTGQTGSALITVTVSDGSRTASTSFTLTVNPGTPWPEFTSPNAATFTIGVPNSFQVVATSTPVSTYNAINLPAWATIDGNTGVLSGTPPVGTAPGNITFTLLANNGVPPGAQQNFTLTLQAIPSVNSQISISTLAGTAGQIGSTDATGAAARFNYPLGVAIDATGNIYLADESNHVIRKVTPAGAVSTLAGTAGLSGNADGNGTAARFKSPSGLAVDSSGNLYVADTLNNTIRKITAAGDVTTVAGTAGIAGTTDGTGAAARFNAPQALAVTATYLFIADTGNHTIRRLTLSSNAVTTFAGSGGKAGSVDGTGTAARLNFPCGIVADSQNRVWVADSGNNTIRAITSTGAVTTLAGLPGSAGAADGTGTAARFNEPSGIALFSTQGVADLYVLDTENHSLRKVTTAGEVTTLAGLPGTAGSSDGIASAARFRLPSGLAINAAGTAAIADTANHTLRVGLLPIGPAITTQPQARSVSMGGSVDFTVIATGYPALSYQWRFNGVDIAGATSATYSISSVAGSHGGGYSVLVSNSLGSVISTQVTLTVTGPNQPASEGSTHGGGGGGAPSLWFLALLAVAGGVRRFLGRRS